MNSNTTILVLGSGEGWHADQLRVGASACGVLLEFADYESLRAELCERSTDATLTTDISPFSKFDAILTRTMPSASMEKITFRLAVLHAAQRMGMLVVNPAPSLELAIDKFATLQVVRSLGYAVPSTIVAQDRTVAMRAFEELGGDCVVKPIFGGEGRGVMRIQDPALAWTVFSTLDRLD
ncbi:MAG: hypothetical protein AAF989_12575, partial [Planctomycetota bacterium]